MPRFAYLKTDAPDTLAAELTKAGYPTEEVMSVAECHELLSNPLGTVTAVIIAPEFEQPDVFEIKQRIMTFSPYPFSTAEDFVKEWKALNLPG